MSVQPGVERLRADRQDTPRVVRPFAPTISVIVIAKNADTAKTRLGLDRRGSREMALWLAAHTIRAAVAAESTSLVLVVTSDPAIAHDASQAGAAVLAENGTLGMNRAAELGRQRALASRPADSIGVLVADLPYLGPEHLDDAFAEFQAHRAPLYVADHLGSGTTFLLHAPRQMQGLAFGRHSARMHERLGYRAAQRPLAGLRRDLDTPEDYHAWQKSAAEDPGGSLREGTRELHRRAHG